MPTEASNKFTGKTGNGPFADMLAEMDSNVGRILDAVSALKIQGNIIFIFISDNGPEDTIPWRGWAGPWSGTYVTLRVPFIIRWPSKVPADRVSNEIVHITDLYTTLEPALPPLVGDADLAASQLFNGNRRVFDPLYDVLAIPIVPPVVEMLG